MNFYHDYTPTELANILASEVDPNDGTTICFATSQLARHVADQKAEIDSLFDRYNFDAEGRAVGMAALVGEIRDLTDRTDRLEGALRRLDRRIQDLHKLVNELMWTPAGVAPTAPPSSATRPF